MHSICVDRFLSWSGITAEALDGVTTTFEEVQAKILTLLSVSPTPVLLGHSLESDLKALKICHPRCIDTAVIFHHPRGRPFKPGLAWLTKKWCSREIQNRGEGGHDPEEDARACLDLLKKKVENGQVILNVWWYLFTRDIQGQDTESSRLTLSRFLSVWRERGTEQYLLSSSTTEIQRLGMALKQPQSSHAKVMMKF